MKLEKVSESHVAKKPRQLTPRPSEKSYSWVRREIDIFTTQSIDIMSGAEIKQYWPYAAELQRRSRAAGARAKSTGLLRRGG